MSSSAGSEGQGPQRLGRYELLGEIASGGMATVFLGRATGSKGFARLVAIKRLHPHLEGEEDFVSMFLDEARLAARIRHPNCVPTLDVEDQDGLYLVMEYVEGDRLLGLLKHAARRGERVPIGIVLRTSVEACAGLHAAHELTDDDGSALNLVHRDISPQNILVGIDGVTKITDFGIAKAESRLTQTRDGQLKGKIAYMAPEQTRRASHQIDRRVDIFAMGIIVWEMLTGRRLFRGESDVEILNALVNEPIPSIRSFVPEVPDELEAVVMKALEREPEDRYSTCAEFGEALEQVSHSVGGLAPTRVVAQYVQQVAGPKLEQERNRLKAGFGGAGGDDAQGQAPRRNTRITSEMPAVQAPMSQVASMPRSTPQFGGSGATPIATSIALPPQRPESGGNRMVFVASLISVAALASGAAFWFASRQPPVAAGRNTDPVQQTAAPSVITVTAQPTAAQPTAAPSVVASAPVASAVATAAPSMMVMPTGYPGPQMMMLPNGQMVMVPAGYPTAMAGMVPMGASAAVQPSAPGSGARPRGPRGQTAPRPSAAATAAAGTPEPRPTARSGNGDDDINGDPIINPYRH